MTYTRMDRIQRRLIYSHLESDTVVLSDFSFWAPGTKHLLLYLLIILTNQHHSSVRPLNTQSFNWYRSSIHHFCQKSRLSPSLYLSLLRNLTTNDKHSSN